MLKEKDIPNFEYYRNYHSIWFDNICKNFPTDGDGFYVHCRGCGQLFSEYETFDANRKKLQKRYNVLDKNNNT